MRTARTLSWLILLTVALTGCPTTPTQPPPAQDFGFTLADTIFAAVPGTSITTSVTITPINGFTGTVALAITNQDGTPADPGITLDPTTITVTSSDLAQQSIQRQVTIDVDNTVANDTYDLTITATSGNLSSTADLTLTVADTLQPQEDFGFTLDNTVLAAIPGGSVITSATVTPINGFTGIVALSASPIRTAPPPRALP